MSLGELIFSQVFLGAMGLVGGSNFIFPRLYRHMFVVAVDSFEQTTLNHIFTSINEWHFSKGYADKVALLSRVFLHEEANSLNLFVNLINTFGRA